MNHTRVFWGELAPSEHIANFYTSDAALLETLSGFVAAGLNVGESTIVIATPQHLTSLRQRLLDMHVDLIGAMAQDRYIALDAETALSTFMLGNWPDDRLFADLVSGLIQRAGVKNRRVRAFGEMVALLWARGHAAATVRLEHLWQQLCLHHSFPLLCAYPKAGFTEDPLHSLNQICAAHSQVM